MSYSSTVLADSPVGFWELDETSTSAATAADSTANALTATYAGTGYTSGQGPLISAGHSTQFFASTTTRAQTATSALIQPGTGGAMSFEAWLFSTAVTTQSILDSDNSTTARLFQFRLETTGKVGCIIFNAAGTSNVAATSASVVNNGAIHYVVATYDGANIRIYIDGTLDSTTACTLVGAAATHPIAIANRLSAAGSTAAFNGALDELAFYNTTLSQSQVTAHFNAGGSAPVPNALLSQDATEVLRQSFPPPNAGLSQIAVELLIPVGASAADISLT